METRQGALRPDGLSDGAGRARPTQRRRVRGPVVFVGLVVVVVLLGGAAVVHRWGGDAPAHAASSQPGLTPAEKRHEPTQEDPGAAAARLTSARMDTVVALTNAPDLPALGHEAGGEADRDGWEGVLVPGSPAHLQAADLVSSLRADGATISGLAVETGDVVVLAQDPASAAAPAAAQVQVTFTISDYTVESADGVLTVPAGTPRTAVLDLVSTEAGWLVAEVHETVPPS